MNWSATLPLPSPLPFCGLLPVNKPVGLTSADVVNRLSAALRKGGVRVKLGHAGTLDKLAEGLLLLLVGKATRWFDELQHLDKVYLADIRLDAFSATDDAAGPLTAIPVSLPPTETTIRQTLLDFTGCILQRPPSFSRVHAAPGIRSDRLAKKAAQAGEPLERPQARPVQVYTIDLLTYCWPNMQLRITCGSGTYVRSLARDLGERLHTGGYLTGLVRERIGPFTLTDAVAILPDQPIHPDEALGWLKRLHEKPTMAAKNG